MFISRCLTFPNTSIHSAERKYISDVVGGGEGGGEWKQDEVTENPTHLRPKYHCFGHLTVEISPDKTDKKVYVSLFMFLSEDYISMYFLNFLVTFTS